MEDARVKELIAYDAKVLDALGIRHGPGHAEIKWCKGEPCLVEIGARCHGCEGCWVPVVNESLGYNQPQMTVDAYVWPLSAVSHARCTSAMGWSRHHLMTIECGCACCPPLPPLLPLPLLFLNCTLFNASPLCGSPRLPSALLPPVSWLVFSHNPLALDGPAVHGGPKH